MQFVNERKEKPSRIFTVCHMRTCDSRIRKAIIFFKNIYYTSLVQDFEFTLLSQGLRREQTDYFTLDEEIVEQ